MSYNTGTLGLPIVLMFSLWGAVNTTLSFYGLLNQRRDQVFGLIQDCGRCTELILGPAHIYYTNMLPLTFGACLFLCLICYVIISLPTYIHLQAGQSNKVKFACRSIASLPAFGLVSFVGGGIFDFMMLSSWL